MIILCNRPFKKNLNLMNLDELKYFITYLGIESNTLTDRDETIKLLLSQFTRDEITKGLKQINIKTKNLSFWTETSHNLKLIHPIKSYSIYHDLYKVDKSTVDYSIRYKEWSINDEIISYNKSIEFDKYRKAIMFLEILEQWLALRFNDLCFDVNHKIFLLYFDIINIGIFKDVKFLNI